jgi:hypothetical protein
VCNVFVLIFIVLVTSLLLQSSTDLYSSSPCLLTDFLSSLCVLFSSQASNQFSCCGGVRCIAPSVLN